jgi:hypothetical protein
MATAAILFDLFGTVVGFGDVRVEPKSLGAGSMM